MHAGNDDDNYIIVHHLSFSTILFYFHYSTRFLPRNAYAILRLRARTKCVPLPSHTGRERETREPVVLIKCKPLPDVNRLENGRPDNRRFGFARIIGKNKFTRHRNPCGQLVNCITGAVAYLLGWGAKEAFADGPYNSMCPNRYT